MVAVVEAEQFVVVGVKRVAVIIGLVIYNFLKIGCRLVPLTVEQIYFTTQSVSSSFGGAAKVGGVPAYRSL